MIVIKIGGVVATDARVLIQLLEEIRALSQRYRFVLVHGGGKEVTTVSEKFALKAEFRSGIRMTSPEEMNVVDMVLGGKINIDLVRKAQAIGLNAVGLGGQDGRLFVSSAIEAEGYPDCRTGNVVSSDPSLLRVLTDAGYFPVLHSTSMDDLGRGLNVNADEAAQEVAIAAKAEALVYVSDIPGVLKDDRVLSRLNESSIEAEIENGTIGGGMIPKVRGALGAVRAGVGKLVIGGYKATGDLKRLLEGSSGTTIE